MSRNVRRGGGRLKAKVCLVQIVAVFAGVFVFFHFELSTIVSSRCITYQVCIYIPGIGFSSHALSFPFLFICFVVLSQIRGHTAGSPRPQSPPRFAPRFINRNIIPARSSLADSRRIPQPLLTLCAISSSFFCYCEHSRSFTTVGFGTHVRIKRI